VPNHVTNKIVASPAVIDAITRVMTDEEVADARLSDAQRAVNYKNRTGNDWPYADDDAEKYTDRFADFAMVVPEPENMFKDGCNMQHPHVVDGHTFDHCWSDWNRNNWGTKWNAYDTHIEPIEGDLCELRFDTAWSHPFPVVEALAKLFPEEQIKVWWADEDMGQNVGWYVIEPGVELDFSIVHDLTGTDEGMELACQLKMGCTYAEYKAANEVEEIEWAQRSAFADRIKAERGIEDGHTVIREEGLEVPEDIKTQIVTAADAEAYWVTQTIDN
jgi:hypothetical protein